MFGESGRSYEHRHQWVEDRIADLAQTFAVAVWGFAVMSNHFARSGADVARSGGELVERGGRGALDALVSAARREPA